jgi:hypothetical protein
VSVLEQGGRGGGFEASKEVERRRRKNQGPTLAAECNLVRFNRTPRGTGTLYNFEIPGGAAKGSPLAEAPSSWQSISDSVDAEVPRRAPPVPATTPHPERTRAHEEKRHRVGRVRGVSRAWETRWRLSTWSHAPRGLVYVGPSTPRTPRTPPTRKTPKDVSIRARIVSSDPSTR